MRNATLLLLVGTLAALAGCTSVQQANSVQLPGETARSGLQVPPDLGERPVQVAMAPQAR
jgi:hypothetical protein